MENFMRRILLATAAFAFSAGMAMAADTANVEINAEQEPLCDITNISPSVSLAGVEVGVAATLTYQCNFEGSPTFTFTSLNGGVYTTENGTALADYGIYVNDVAPGGLPSSWLQASTATTPQVFPGISFSAPPNTPINPYFSVGLTQPLPVAGVYTDTLTVSIAP
jgi:spore coat protein U-like protein